MAHPDSAHSWNLQQGIGAIHWNMSDEQVRGAVPLAEPLGRYRGRNPKTGEEVVSPAGFLISSFVRLDCGVTITAATESDGHGVAAIRLRPAQAPDLQPVDGPVLPHIAPERVNIARREIATRLGVGPIDETLTHQNWTVGSCQLALSNEWDDFVFEVERPRAP